MDSSLPVPSVPLPDVSLIVGPVLIGNLFAWCAFGVLLAQFYFYRLTTSFRDGHILSITIYGLLALEILQTIAGTDAAWTFAVRRWGHPNALVVSTWSIPMIPLLSGLVGAWVQAFFARRILVLSRSHVLTAFIGVMALAQGACGVAVGIRFAQLESFAYISTLKPLVIAWLVGSAANNVVIAAAMVFFLAQARAALGRAANPATSRVLSRLLVGAIETGCLTAAVSLLDVGLELGPGTAGTNAHLIACILITKMYTNSLLASLNARALPDGTPRERRAAPEPFVPPSFLNGDSITAIGEGPGSRPEKVGRMLGKGGALAVVDEEYALDSKFNRESVTLTGSLTQPSAMISFHTRRDSLEEASASAAIRH